MWTYHYLTQRQGRDYHYSIMLLSAITKMFCIGQRSQWPKKSPSFFLYRSYCIKDVCICMNGLTYEETTTAEPNTSLNYLNRFVYWKYHFCHFTYVTISTWKCIMCYKELIHRHIWIEYLIELKEYAKHISEYFRYIKMQIDKTYTT